MFLAFLNARGEGATVSVSEANTVNQRRTLLPCGKTHETGEGGVEGDSSRSQFWTDPSLWHNHGALYKHASTLRSTAASTGNLGSGPFSHPSRCLPAPCRPCLALDASDNSLGPVGLHTLVDGLRGPLLRVSLARTGLFGRVGGQAVARRGLRGLEPRP